MNFTQNFYNEEMVDDINTDICPELIINPRFYGNQSLDNLLELKLKVHSILNVGFTSPCACFLILFCICLIQFVCFIFFSQMT